MLEKGPRNKAAVAIMPGHATLTAKETESSRTEAGTDEIPKAAESTDAPGAEDEIPTAAESAAAPGACSTWAVGNRKSIVVRAYATSERWANTQHSLAKGEQFRVCEERRANDGTVLLRLADGRGWVFDRNQLHGLLCERVLEGLQYAGCAATHTDRVTHEL